MDDDVQYLGTRLAVAEPVADPCGTPTTGITLHIEKCGDKPAHALSFYRTHSGHVNIGRKSRSDDRSMRRENDNHNAVFSCQVVSARHAKLVLSDSGQIYIVDLHSRHGTHLLRRSEPPQRMLPPGVETPLADGDMLTFGKVVGAGSYHVAPVTVRVELLTSLPSPEPPVGRALTPFSPPSPVLSRLRKLSSGRYGLITASCIESDSSQSSSSVSVSSDVALSPSEHESDMEDEHACFPPVLRDDQSKPSVKIPAFRSFIRDIYHHTTAHSPIVLDGSDDPLDDIPDTPLPPADVVRPPSPVVVVIEPFSRSRSHSPMEVATPSPSPPSEAPQSEPAIIGAWPASRPESPRPSLLEVATGRSEVPPAPELDREPELVPAQPSAGSARPPPLSNDALLELMHRLPPPPPFFPMGGPFSTSIASDFGLPSVPPPPPPPFPPHRQPPFQPLHKVVTECVNSEIKGAFRSVEERITVLQETINSLKSRQSVAEDDVMDLQGRVETLESESERMLGRISGAERNIASTSTLQGQMATLQYQVTSLRERLDAPDPRPVEAPMEDVRACANALSNLAFEMKLMREDVEKRIEARMEAIQNARAEALDAMKEVVVAAESVRSSKRKRDDVEGDEETQEAVAPLDIAVVPVACSPPPVVDEALVDVPNIPQVPIPQVPVSFPVLPVLAPEAPACEPIRVNQRPHKRPRTTVYTIAHTAAAMAIGAAATWSALAFS